jgi:hypothetical protein
MEQVEEIALGVSKEHNFVSFTLDGFGDEFDAFAAKIRDNGVKRVYGDRQVADGRATSSPRPRVRLPPP